MWCSIAGRTVRAHCRMILTSADDFSVEIYGTIAPATKEACNALPFPVKYFDTKFGYSRVA